MLNVQVALVIWAAFAMCILPTIHGDSMDLNASALLMNVPVSRLPWKVKLAIPKVIWKQTEIADIFRLSDYRAVDFKGISFSLVH